MLGALEFDPENAADSNVGPKFTTSDILTACQYLVEEVQIRHSFLSIYCPTFRFIHLSVQDFFEGLKQEAWSKRSIHTFAAELCLHRLLDPERVSDCAGFTSVAASNWAYHAQIADRTQQVNANPNPNLAEPALRKLLREFIGTSDTVPSPFTRCQEAAASYKIYALARVGVGTDGRRFSIPYGNNAIKPRSVDVACYLGLESVFNLMLTQTPRPKTCFDFGQVVASLRRGKGWASNQYFLVLSPATTPDMLFRYLKMATQITGVPPLDTLWHVMMEAMMHLHDWGSSSAQEIESLHSVLAQTIVEVALRLLSCSRDEFVSLLLATLKLIPEPYDYNRDHRRAQSAARRTLAAKGLDICSQPEESLELSWHARCLGSAATMMQAFQPSHPAHVLARELESLQIGLISVLGAVPGAGTVNQSRRCFDAVTDGIYDLIHAQHACTRAKESSCKALETVVSMFASKTDAVLRERLLSPYLIYAIMYCRDHSQEACRMLLRAGAQDANDVTIDRFTRRSRTAKTAEQLRMAYDQAPGPSVRYMLTVENKADATRTSSGTRRSRPWTTALMACCIYRPKADTTCDLLLSHSVANINTTFTGRYGTALIAACAKGNFGFCRTLLARGANPNLLCCTGPFETALIASCSCKDSGRWPEADLAELLLSYGAKIDLNGRKGRYGTALIAACAQGNVSRAQTLLAHGADPNVVCSTGPFRTALIAACAWEHGVHDKLSTYPTSIDEALQEDRKRSVIRQQMCSLLLDYGADANMVVPGGRFRTALIAASRSDDVGNCDRLIEAGAKVDQFCDGDYTSPMTAAREVTIANLQRSLRDPRFRRREAICNKMGPSYRPMVLPGETHRFLLKLSATDSGFLNAAEGWHRIFES